jgi:hypothetical protein
MIPTVTYILTAHNLHKISLVKNISSSPLNLDELFPAPN